MPMYRSLGTTPPSYERLYRAIEIKSFAYNGPCYVYALLDAEDKTEEVRYIGVTGNPAKRYFQHAKGRANCARAAWAREAYSRLAMTMIIICLMPSREEALKEEGEIIKLLSSPILFNVTHNAHGAKQAFDPSTTTDEFAAQVPSSFTKRFEAHALHFWIQTMANEQHPDYRQFQADIVLGLATGRFRGKHFGPTHRDKWNDCARFYLVEHCGVTFEAINERREKGLLPPRRW